jgi:SAM-dependent methyltransferase
MTGSNRNNADAWGLPGVLDFFTRRRATTDEVYASEWLFLKDRLTEGVSVLDVGCAQGGFASILGEHLDTFAYTGVDINAEMIARARDRHPGHTFHHVEEGTFELPATAKFDLVLVLGILHLHESWRETLTRAWAHTCGTLIFDIREKAGPTLEDKSRSYFKMDFNSDDASHAETTLPYIIVNSGEALACTLECCPDASHVQRYGYQHPTSDSAVTSVENVMASVYCIER